VFFSKANFSNSNVDVANVDEVRKFIRSWSGCREFLRNGAAEGGMFFLGVIFDELWIS
jgi:hypothetical protein